MDKKIAVLGGDGIGPEVMQSAISVLDAIAQKFEHKFTYVYGLVGGDAYDKYQNHLPEATIDLCQDTDAILFGSVGGPIDKQHEPKWAGCEANSILALRKAFNFGSNLRTAKIYGELTELSPLKKEVLGDGIDVVIFRELLGDVYFGEHSLGEKDGQGYAFDSGSYTEEQISNIAHRAFQIARLRNKNVVSVDKANVLAMSKLWRQVVKKIALQYPDVVYSDMLVDNCAMQIIKNPRSFDVILTSNLFGDILSDELSVLSGSIGMMPSASFNQEGFALYEPAGGSAPDIAGKNIANPIAQILSAAMMLNYSFGLKEEALAIDNAVSSAIAAGFRTGDLKTSNSNDVILGTKEFTEQVIKFI